MLPIILLMAFLAQTRCYRQNSLDLASLKTKPFTRMRPVEYVYGCFYKVIITTSNTLGQTAPLLGSCSILMVGLALVFLILLLATDISYRVRDTSSFNNVDQLLMLTQQNGVYLCVNPLLQSNIESSFFANTGQIDFNQDVQSCVDNSYYRTITPFYSYLYDNADIDLTSYSLNMLYW